jgi:hypothetical protein
MDRAGAACIYGEGHEWIKERAVITYLDWI